MIRLLKEKIENSISKQFIFILALSMIITFVIVIMFINHLVGSRIFNVVDVNTFLTTEQNIQFIGTWFEERKNQIEDYADIPIVQSMDWEKAEDYLKSRHKKHSNIYDNIWIADIEGDFITTDGIKGNARERDYFDKVLNGEVVFSEPLISLSTGNPIVIIVAPIFSENNQVIGVIGGSILLDNLTEFISDMRVEHPDSYSYIIDNSGLNLAHPNTDLILEANMKDIPAFEGVVDNVLNKSYGEVDYVYEGVKTYAYFYEIPNTDGWKLITRVPAEFIDEPISEVRNRLMIALIIALFILLIIGYKVISLFGKGLNLAAIDFEKMANYDFTDIKEEDLTKRKDEFGRLGRAYNKINFAMKNMITNVLNNVDNLSAHSEELSAAGDQVADGASQITQSIQDVASGAEESTVQIEYINQSIKYLTDEIEGIESKTKQMIDVSNSVLEDIEKGNQSVNKSVKVINEVKDDTKEVADIIFDLGETSNQINCIVGLINDIADQTSLLSLNATIEAARAKKYGEGFAVVAEEIRDLANETSKGTNNIANLINNVQEKVNKAVKKIKENEKTVKTGVITIEETGILFKDIKKVVNELSNIIIDVTNSTKNMTSNSREVKEKVQNIAEVTEEFAANTEEVSASSEEQAAATEEIISASYELSEMAHTLQNLVEQFKV
ncbi:methyl-accepting chemotaxis protein [Halonatronum saccharophilum]|uniref:methyl-accepting chemotaxis protein n=1 Tax=Halonatronum saccharophilum TaxID=150060 RepID=UPI0004B9B12A|nr:methyl-accepting chemotaxis protein [Halonatronum saccharophilum]